MKTRDEIQAWLASDESPLWATEEVLLADGFEEAFLGVGRQFNEPFAVYDRAKCLEILERDMTPEEAVEYFDFNVSGAWVGPQTPVFLDFACGLKIPA